MTQSLPPRVRFAPAPSGVLHVGSVRTALYNWLYAKRHGGTFVFRIEDTDAERATDESAQSMLDAMEWIGLVPDEGMRVGGPYGPYKQSERRELAQIVARKLEERGDTYRDYRTSEELDAWRSDLQTRKLPPIVKRANAEPTADEQAGFEAEGRTYSLRLATPADGSVSFTDLVRGEMSFEWATISDPVILRSDGSPTYPLANSVDDVAQGISLICRGEDLLSVTPRQVFLYDLLLQDGLIDAALAEAGLPARDPAWTRPDRFAHLSMIVGVDRKKLSKRHGSVAIQEFARMGFLPEVMLNYLALLGWSPGDGREQMSVDEVIAAFDFSGVGKSAAAFDVDKLTAFNGDRIRELSTEELAVRLVPYLDGTYGAAQISNPPTEDQHRMLVGLVPLVQERMQRLDEVEAYASAFFRADVTLDPDSVEKVLAKEGVTAVLEAAIVKLGGLEDWSDAGVEEALRALKDELEMGAKKVFQPIRVAVTGSAVSPPLFESIALLSRELVVERLRLAVPHAG